MATGTVVLSNTGAGTSSAQGHQALKVITGHKTATLFAQVIAKIVMLMLYCNLLKNFYPAFQPKDPKAVKNRRNKQK